MVVWTPSDLPARLPQDGSRGSYGFYVDIRQSIHQGWVKTLGNVMWLWTSEGTHMCSGQSDVNAH